MRNLGLDLFCKVCDEMGHKYYFATFEYFRGRDISHGISPGIHISASLTNGIWETLFNTFQNNLNCAFALNFVMKLKLMQLKLTETIFALGLRLSCHTTIKLGKIKIYNIRI